MNKKHLWLKDLRGKSNTDETAFEVTKIQNSVRYYIGEYLDQPEVERLCTNHDWTVTITK